MKILYAVQATGNGHISRAMELLPLLKRNAEVDIFLSGNNSHLSLNAPVTFRSKGLSLYFNSTGALDYWKILRGFHPLSLRKEINELPVEKYDLVINDFEFITAAACAKKKVSSVQVGHQASFQSALTPRPANKSAIGEWILKNYARASHYIGLHFEPYDDFILPPVIKKEISQASPADHGYITIYLPAYSSLELKSVFQPFSNSRFHIFSHDVDAPFVDGNISFRPVDRRAFNQSMINCSGMITGAGFETPAEGLYLGKKMICIPTRGQYEQLCNAAALQRLGVTCIKKLDAGFPSVFSSWLEKANPSRLNYPDITNTLVRRILSTKKEPDIQHEQYRLPVFQY